jgi:hypothetical protein
VAAAALWPSSSSTGQAPRYVCGSRVTVCCVCVFC